MLKKNHINFFMPLHSVGFSMAFPLPVELQITGYCNLYVMLHLLMMLFLATHCYHCCFTNFFFRRLALKAWPSSMPIGSYWITERLITCTPATVFCSTTKAHVEVHENWPFAWIAYQRWSSSWFWAGLAIECISNSQVLCRIPNMLNKSLRLSDKPAVIVGEWQFFRLLML